MMKIVRVNRVYLVLSAHREVLERFTTFAEARTYIGDEIIKELNATY